jgi:uncharacterized protein (DUF885 family)
MISLPRAALVLLFAAGAMPAAQPVSIDDFFRDFTAEWVRHDPERATATRYFSGEEQDRLERQLTPRTPAWRREHLELARRGIAGLRKFDRSKMTELQRVSADLMEWQLQSVADMEPFLDYVFPLEQFQGANVNLPNTLIVVHPLVTPHDAENYVAALGQVAARLEEAMADSRRLAAKQILPPRFILRATIKQMQGFIDGRPEQNPFVTTLSQKMQAIQSMPEKQRQELRAQAAAIVDSQVYPAYRKAIALLESQISRSTDDAGLWRLKGGAEGYANALRRFTTTDMTAAQIHELGLRQVETIERQMDEILRRMGRSEGTVKDRVAKLQEELRYPNPASTESREQIMRDIDGILADAQRRAAMLFDKKPRASIVAQPYPTFQEANNAARSVPPSPDGSRPGIFLYPRRLEWMTKFQPAWCITRLSPAISIRLACKPKMAIYRDSAKLMPSVSSPLMARDGGYTRRGWRPNRDGMKATPRACSARSTPNSSARGGW